MSEMSEKEGQRGVYTYGKRVPYLLKRRYIAQNAYLLYIYQKCICPFLSIYDDASDGWRNFLSVMPKQNQISILRSATRIRPQCRRESDKAQCCVD